MKHSLIALALLSAGCLPLSADTPIEAYELDGTWCSYKLCLRVDSPHNTGLPFTTYEWESPVCHETGRLTGGLEFTPDTSSSLCVAPEYDLYSAAGSWTPSGIKLRVDASTNEVRAGNGQPIEYVTFDLTYQP